MNAIPSGTVTFLFTDIEGSTQLWQQHRQAMPAALQRHHTLLKQAIQVHHGYVFQIVGDAFCAAFHTAIDGLQAALEAQRLLYQEHWEETGPLRVRMGLHSGQVDVRSGEFTSGEYLSNLTLSRVSRLLSAAHGGQVLLSQVTRDLLVYDMPPEASLKDLGEHRLKGLSQPEHIYQLVAPDLQASFSPLNTLDARPNNLPIRLTSFIGRDAEKAEVKKQLGLTHLLTLTGPGGCGKTSLALETASALIDGYMDGVWLIELAPLSDPGFVVQTVAQVLGLREQPGLPLVGHLADYLQTRDLLLVLDNCEHLVDACASLAETILSACPNVHILATSREALNIPGEKTWQVPSLGLPDSIDDFSQVIQSEAVYLFTERAKAVSPVFQLTGKNAPVVAQICRRLDGIPLAIELAAARAKVLSVEQIASRLDQRFSLLTSGSRKALARQQTLRAAIDWSYALLSGAEQALLRRVSVFSGGWSLAAAEFVCEGDSISGGLILDLLAQLVNKSLVIVENQDQESRFHILETIRQYAAELLEQSGEEEQAREHHLQFYLSLAEEAEPRLTGPDQVVWLNRLETEHENLRAALRWALDSGQSSLAEDNCPAALRLSRLLWQFWYVHGHWTEGRRWLQEAIDQNSCSTSATYAWVLCGAGGLACSQNDYQQAQEVLTKSRAVFQQVGDKRGHAQALFWMAMVATDLGEHAQLAALLEESSALQREVGDISGLAYNLHLLGEDVNSMGDHERAIALFQESLALFKELGDKWAIALSLTLLASTARYQGNHLKAIDLIVEALALWRDLGDRRQTGIALHELGLITLALGEYTQARNHLAEALQILRTVGDRWAFTQSLEGLATLACTQSAWKRSARLYAAASKLRQTINVPVFPADRDSYDRDLAAIKGRIGEKEFDKAWLEGSQMTPEEAMAFALSEPETTPAIPSSSASL